MAVSPGATGDRKVFKIYWGGVAEGDNGEKRGHRISVSSPSVLTLQLGSWARARRSWLGHNLVVTVYASIGVGGRVGAELMLMPWRANVQAPRPTHATGLSNI
jgi:hypothetical protein